MLNENKNKIRIGIVFLLMHVVQGMGGIVRKKKYNKRLRKRLIGLIKG